MIVAIDLASVHLVLHYLKLVNFVVEYRNEQVVFQLNPINLEISQLTIEVAEADLATVDFVVVNSDYYFETVVYLVVVETVQLDVIAEFVGVVAVLEDFECFVAVEFVEVVAFVEVAVP